MHNYPQATYQSAFLWNIENVCHVGDEIVRKKIVFSTNHPVDKGSMETHVVLRGLGRQLPSDRFWEPP